MLNKSEVKYIQSLSQKKFRDEEGVYIAEGPKIVEEALEAKDVVVKKLFATEKWAGVNERYRGITLVADYELQKISQLKTPNQVLAVLKKPSYQQFIFDKSGLSLALDGIQDPGNLGTIIRTADWFGVKQVICSTDCADAFSAKVVQAAMGSIFRVQVVYADLEGWMAENRDIAFYGAALNGKPLTQFSKMNAGTIVIGNESKGIREGVMQKVNEKITIARSGGAESLNAAVAAGIILAHLVRSE